MDEIRRAAGDDIVGMTPTVAVPAMLNFQVRGQWVTRQIMFIGIDEATHARVSDFGRYLQHPGNRTQLSFDLREGGYDTVDSQSEATTPTRPALEGAGWPHRRMRVERERVWREKLEADRRASEAADPTAASGSGGPTRSIDRQVDAVLAATTGDEASAVAPPAIDVADTTAVVKPPDPFRQARPEEGTRMDPAREQFTGIVPGIGLASFRDSTGVDRFLVLPGDDVKVTFPTAGTPPKAVSDSFTIVDYYESKMSEYDSNFVFVPLAMLQRMRGMIDPQTGLASVNSIQIKLREGADLDLVRDKLRKVFPADLYAVATWRDKQGPLLAAVDMEMSVLNILLFLIIAVAGFGILAIFFMIVVEKTRDIGILKSLGAGASGIAGIFLGYGLFLGLVGAGAGLAMGLAIAWNINTIRVGVEWLTGQRVFDPSIYYFHRIPSIVDPFTVAWIIVGAVGIAVASSVLPALRAARLHPVEALRHD
jgi:lipoprotein-releasing system permease protein